MFVTPRSRLLWARTLIPLMAILAVFAAVNGTWPMAVGLVILIGTQVLVYRRAKEELGQGD